MSTERFPAWLAHDPESPSVVVVDGAAAYPWALEKLGRLEEAPDDLLNEAGDEPGPGVDRYWLDVAFRFIQWKVKMELAIAELNPRPAASLTIRIKQARKDLWAQSAHPKGKYDPASADPMAGWKAILRDASNYWQRLTGLKAPE